MENDINETQGQTEIEHSSLVKSNPFSIPASILISAIVLAGAWIYTSGPRTKTSPVLDGYSYTSEVAETGAVALGVLPEGGSVLPVRWENTGAKLVSVGAIDLNKFKAIYEERGAFTDEYKNLLLGQNNGQLKITEDNAGYLLNLFWALGLSSKNPILENGEMTDPAYGGAGGFASTGGWTVAVGDPMDHYSRHKFFDLTLQQQALVDKVSKGIYRPCCGNSTHFPDCNHGMAMLGLLELMASQGASEREMWQTALVVNSYWFPDTYVTIATYMKNKGVAWKDVDPKEMLGKNYSSVSGFQKISASVPQKGTSKGGSGCGVESVNTKSSSQPQSSGGCGI